MAFYIPGPTDLGYNQATDTVTNTSGEDAQLPLATDELNGLMSAAHRALTEALIGAGVDVEGNAVLIPHIHGDLAGSVYIHVKNTSGGQLAKGTPVRVVGQVGDTTMLEVAAANSASSNTMPAIGLLADTLAQNGTGHAVVAGELTGLNTAGYGVNQSLFVASGGGLTGTAPTSGITQQIAIVGRVHANTGTVAVTVSTPLSLVTSTAPGLAPAGAGGVPGGSAGSIQIHNGEINPGLDAVTGLEWDSVNDRLDIPGDINLDDGGTFTTTLQCITPTANRTISFPDATGIIALVAGSSGQLLYNLNGVVAGSSITFDSTNGTRFTLPFGYGIGAGGTQTQATSKSTGVTLNARCGQITMNAAELAANTAVSFTLTNSQVAATDLIIINHVSGGTTGAYMFGARAASGSATITVRNVTAGALSEGVVIAFAIVKATTN